ncbi:MAG: PQQ-like beta-propeller repeat protein, partial [Planctomycetales bacterium]|nr:PQQ-like beta-propeller repeat protein [Planctomycetales bacterium]
PGAYFFGYSYYLREDGSRLLLMAAQNGLHAMDGDTGQDVWHFARENTGGITPAVDQANGWIFYQCNHNVFKLDARSGDVLATVAVPTPSRCIAWNTVLTDDTHGAYVATYWIGPSDSNEWGSGIRVYDKDLNLLWEKTGLPAGKKATLTYADGKLVVGSGNQWGARYTDNRWKYIAALAVDSGAEVWKCDLSKFDYTCILNVPYFNGNFYAETQDTPGISSKVFKIDGQTGKLEQVLDYGRDISSCATSIIARGKLLSGDLVHDRLVVTQLACGASGDWLGPFGHPQLNPMSLPADPAARPVPMREVPQSRSPHEN